MYPPPGYYSSSSTTTTFNNALPTTTKAITLIAPYTTRVMLSLTSSSSSSSSSSPNLLTITPTTSAIAAFLTATATAIVTDGTQKYPQTSPFDHEPENGECKLLGSFALLVQAALGGCALLALVYKRWRERPQRPVKIWFFDASKQVVGSGLVHVANLGMSLLSSGQFSIKVEPRMLAGKGWILGRGFDVKGHYTPNPCSFYLLNLAIDTTLGIPILIVLLRLTTAIFRLTNFGHPHESIQSGNYGSPPRASWWAKQSFIYFIGLMLMKLCVLIIFLLLPWISQVGDWALRWTEGNETLQVVFVMLFFPLVMNATQYYIIDSFIKKQDGATVSAVEGGSLEEADESGTGSFEEMDSSDIDGDHGESAEDERKKSLLGISKLRDDTQKRKSLSSLSKKIKTHEYDPELDGENSPTVVVGSGSSSDMGSGPRRTEGVEGK